jgi:hypothetical protein
MPPKSSSRQLFEWSRSNPLFDAVLHGAEMCETSLSPLIKTLILSTLLPLIVNVQMLQGITKIGFCFVFGPSSLHKAYSEKFT